MKNCDLSSWKNAALTRTGWSFGALLLGAILAALPFGGVSAQCTNNLSVHTYDTVITGPGYGTYNLSFPKWRTDSGLLVSVKVSAVVSVQYSYLLKNTDATAGTYDIWVGREDYFTSPALTAAYDNLNERKIATHTLSPGDQVVQGPMAYLSNYANTDSITGSVAPFLGTGTVSFTYSPITYTNIRTSNNVSYGYHATATESTHFTVSYLYCNGDGILASDLSAFTASLRGPSTVQLNWSMATEQKDRVYEIQRSGDGLSFNTIGYTPAELPAGMGTVSYAYTDRLEGDGWPGAAGPVAGGGGGNGGNSGNPGNGGGKWYYRLRLVSVGGISYSPVQTVTMPSGGANRLVVFPNPAVDHINLLVPGDPDAQGDWLVNIRAVDGRLMQSATFYHSNSLPLFFHQHLSPGVYFVQVTDLQGRLGRVTSFRVDGR
ncbi:MAG TPA: T9SS type A sorting domain-containing protein [Puia sp.]|nr:T9SS type A sorting domain-containing protein [Puia sp.]